MGKILRLPPTWVIEEAWEVSKKSDCDRLNVGAVMWGFDNTIVSRGYNRAPTGSERNCRDHGHLMVGGHCVRTVHAETVAVTSSDRYTGNGLMVHVTHTPCPHCIKMLIETRVRQVTWSVDYGNAEGAVAVLSESRLFWGRVE